MDYSMFYLVVVLPIAIIFMAALVYHAYSCRRYIKKWAKSNNFNITKIRSLYIWEYIKYHVPYDGNSCNLMIFVTDKYDRNQRYIIIYYYPNITIIHI